MSDHQVADLIQVCAVCGKSPWKGDVACRRCKADFRRDAPFVSVGSEQPDSRAKSSRASRALLFVGLAIAVNIVINLSVRFFFEDSDDLASALVMLQLGIIQWLVNAALIVLAFVFGMRAIRETADPHIRGRGKATFAVVIASLLAIDLIIGIALTLVELAAVLSEM